MPREAYKQAIGFFVETAAQVSATQWEQPGLGEWNVRELVAHTSRAMLTVREFAVHAPGAPTPTADLATSLAYYHLALAADDINERVAERGRATAASMGPDLLPVIREMAAEVSALVDTLADDHIFVTTIGGIRLLDYLPTRTVELMVHTLDLQAATGIEAAPPRDAMLTTLRVLAELAVASPHAGRLALLATGREAWAGPFTVLG
jgi:uncharacterized protein (TIGR03083 family)